MTSKGTIRSWLQDKSDDQDVAHMIVVTDTFDYEDFPVYVFKCDDIQNEVLRIRGYPMQKVMGMYSYALPLEDQIIEFRAWNLH